MKCSWVKKKLSAFSDGEVSEEERQLIAEHLRSCETCRREFETLSRVSATVQIIDGIKVSPFFVTRLKQRIADQKSESIIRLPFLEWVRSAAFPIAAAVVVFVSFLIGSNLGKAIYHDRAEIMVKSDTEITSALGVSSFDEFPEGSLGWAYNNVLTGGEW